MDSALHGENGDHSFSSRHRHAFGTDRSDQETLSNYVDDIHMSGLNLLLLNEMM
jgi:hypothetical protein